MSRFLPLILLVGAVVGGVLGAQMTPSCALEPLPSVIRVTAIPDLYFSGGPPQSGFLVDLMNGIQSLTGIPFVITSRPDLTYGTRNADGSFNGSLIGELVNKNADLVGVDLTITSARQAVADFVMPFQEFFLVLLNNKQHGINAETQFLAQEDVNLEFLKNSENATIRGYYNNIQAGRPDSIVANDSAGAAKVATGNFAYVAEFPAANRAIADPVNQGKLRYSISSRMGSFFLTMAVQRNSPLRAVVSNAMTKLNEQGFIGIWLDKYDLVGRFPQDLLLSP